MDLHLVSVPAIGNALIVVGGSLRRCLSHGRLELEASTLTLTESQFALAALAMLGSGERHAVEPLGTLSPKVRSTLVPRMG
jgi:hypothetical protein